MISERTIVLLVLALGAGVAAVWGLDRREPVEQVDNIAMATARPGGDALIRSRVIRHRVCPTRFERSFIDAARVRTVYEPQEFTAVGGEGPDELVNRLAIPLSARTGPAIVRFTISWQCNPLHQVWPVVRQIEIPVEVVSALTGPA